MSRYKIIWGYRKSKSFGEDILDYETVEDYLQELSLMIEVHCIDIKETIEQLPHQYIYILDFETEKIMEFCNRTRKFMICKNLKMYDDHFRKPGEIPDGYEFDSGEYEGWLQYRWGDGKNAIEKKVIPVKKEKEEIINPLILSTRFAQKS